MSIRLWVLSDWTLFLSPPTESPFFFFFFCLDSGSYRRPPSPFFSQGRNIGHPFNIFVPNKTGDSLTLESLVSSCESPMPLPLPLKGHSRRRSGPFGLSVQPVDKPYPTPSRVGTPTSPSLPGVVKRDT